MVLGRPIHWNWKQKLLNLRKQTKSCRRNRYAIFTGVEIFFFHLENMGYGKALNLTLVVAGGNIDSAER